MTNQTNPTPNSKDWRTDEERASWRRFIKWLLGKDHPWLKEEENVHPKQRG